MSVLAAQEIQVGKAQDLSVRNTPMSPVYLRSGRLLEVNVLNKTLSREDVRVEL
jgi:hypothetical protein